MKILLTTDGSPNAKAAGEFLRELPLPGDVEIIVATVMDKWIYKGRQNDDLPEEQQQSLVQIDQILLEEAEMVLDGSEETLGDKGLRCTRRVLVGRPAEEIVRLATDEKVDLVVLGSHGHGRIKRFLLGSVSDRVLQYAPCSVLLVRPHGTGKVTAAERLHPLDILLAYDGSPMSQRAAEFCASLPLDKDTEVTAITVLPLITLYHQEIRQRLNWVWKEKKKIAQKGLDSLASELPWSTGSVKTLLREGENVAQEILDAAEENGSDLIVFGNKGKGTLQNILLGSVTSRIAHHANCSVLAHR